MARFVEQGVRNTARWVGDRITDYTGLAAVRVPLARATGPRAESLHIRGYLQTSTYACGAIAAASVVRYFEPEVEFSTVWAAVAPSPATGAGTKRVATALRSFGLRVAVRRKLRFGDLCQAIDAGRLVLVVIRNPGADCRHWVVVYGYRWIPDQLFVANNNLPFFKSNRVRRSTFERLWEPRGNGLACARGNRPVHPHRRAGRNK